MAPRAEPHSTPAGSDGTRRNAHWLVFQFLLRLFYSVWLRYQARGIENIPPTGGGLLLVNHQSFLDPTLVGVPLLRPISYLARDTLFPVPIVGWILKNTYVVPLSRDSASTASIRTAIARMQEGFLIGIFPEGTRSADGELGEFKPGFISLIRRSGVPVYPVGIAGASEAMPRGRLKVFPRTVRVVFGKPLDPARIAELSGRGQENALVAYARDAVSACHEQAETWRRYD